MAYVDQAKKARIAAEVKKVVPKGWKYSLSVYHHSTIVLTVQSAPVDLIAQVNERHKGDPGERTACTTHTSINPYYAKSTWGEDHPFARIVAALNLENHDRSDIMSDYHDVGHYVELRIGKWDKPFEVSA